MKTLIHLSLEPGCNPAGAPVGRAIQVVADANEGLVTVTIENPYGLLRIDPRGAESGPQVRRRRQESSHGGARRIAGSFSTRLMNRQTKTPLRLPGLRFFKCREGPGHKFPARRAELKTDHATRRLACDSR